MQEISILIVDDSETDRYLLKRVIQKTELVANIFESDNGQEALDLLNDYDSNKSKYGESFPPLLVFLDINMPLVDGFEFLEQFSKLRTTQKDYESMVIILLSSSEHADDKRKAFAYDYVHDYIIKGSISTKELRERISAIVDERFS